MLELLTIHGPLKADPSKPDVRPVGLVLQDRVRDGWDPWGVIDRDGETWIFLKRPMVSAMFERVDIGDIPGTLLQLDAIEGVRMELGRNKRSRRREKPRAAKGKKR